MKNYALLCFHSKESHKLTAEEGRPIIFLSDIFIRFFSSELKLPNVILLQLSNFKL